MSFRAGEIIYADDLNEALGNSGVQNNLDVTAASGWEIMLTEYQILGKIMFLRMQVKRTGSNITANAYNAANPGNIAGDPVMFTINDLSKRPTMQVFHIFQGSVNAGAMEINAGTGQGTISDAYPSSAVSTNDTLEFHVSYPIA